MKILLVPGLEKNHWVLPARLQERREVGQGGQHSRTLSLSQALQWTGVICLPLLSGWRWTGTLIPLKFSIISIGDICIYSQKANAAELLIDGLIIID